MNITVDNSSPWFHQLESFKALLIAEALKKSKYNQKKAAEILGVSEKTLRNKVKQTPNLVPKKRLKSPSEEQKSIMVVLFCTGLSTFSISTKYDLSVTTVRGVLTSKLRDTYKTVLTKNKRISMMNYENAVLSSQKMTLFIINKIKENKVEELNEEELFYAKILKENGFITSIGEITDLGEKALFN